MKKTEIINYIKQFNLNREIKWKVKENTENLIVITNSYSDDIRFEIKAVDNGRGGKNIDVIDCFSFAVNIAYYEIGKELYCDYESTEDAIKPALKAIVKHFYYYY